MTREEAIEWLTNEKWENANNKYKKEWNEAFDMAIEALHREEAEEKGYCHRIMPSNVEVVVRCKDCRHKVVTKDGEYNEEDIVCDYWLSDGLDSNDFCSYGERSEAKNE